MIIQINMLIHYAGEEAKKRVERILYITPSAESLVSIDIFDQRALPFWRSVEEIELSLASSAARILQQDPLAKLHGSEVAL